MCARFERRETSGRRVVEQSTDEIDGHGRRSIAEHLRERIELSTEANGVRARASNLIPRVRLDLWKAKFLIVRVHLSDLFATGRA